MAAFVCRFCGAALELSNSTVCECKSCGRIQSVPLIDSTEKNELLLRAEQLRGEQRYDKAIQLYEKMLSLSPKDADLYWALALCKYGVLFFMDGGVTLNRTQAHSFLSDSDYHQALGFANEKQREFMEQTARLIDEKRREIAELSATANYDVLLCCRNAPEDISRAAELYRKLSFEKNSVFFPEITLKDKAKSEWEPYIFGAVNSAKTLLVIVTGTDTFEDIATENICGRFLSGDMTGRAVIPILYGVSPSVLTPELSRFQALNANNLGFEQDLIASVKALLSGQSFDEPLREKSPLVRRAYIMLSDGEFDAAAALCERIEPQDPAEAALIRLLCEYSLSSEEALGKLSADIMQSENYRRAMQYGTEAMRSRLKKYALSALENLQTGKNAKNQSNSLFSEFDGTDDVYSANVKPVKKRSRFLPLAIGVISVVIIGAAVFGVVLNNAGKTETDSVVSENEVSQEKSSFEHAKALFDEEKYSEAEAVFVSLGDYNTSKSWANKCRYKQAEQLLAQGDTENARSIFQRLGSYDDSSERMLECDYKSAELSEERGEYQTAAEAFEALGSFADSKSRKNGCLYQLALELYENGDINSAEQIFEKLGGFSDSDKQLKRIKYERAEKYYEVSSFSEAYEIFSELDGWEDSAERATDALYHQAKEMFEDKQYFDAISPLTKLGNYLDSHDMLNASWLETAIDKIDNGYKRDAYDILTFKIDDDYSPALPYISALRNEVLEGAGWSHDIYFGKYYGNYTGNPNDVMWCVVSVEGNKALVVSENALDYLPFDTGGSSSWAGSSLRSWLNGEFYDSVFSVEEKALIVDTYNDGVTDKVFLLSYDEAATKYSRLVSPNKYIATYYTQEKMPENSEVHCWGRDGILSKKPTETGYERLTVSPTEPNLVFPAIWIKIG
ncbi:MAG: DUF6273 domain-containing protein [Oscillospiraceae bacterium]